MTIIYRIVADQGPYVSKWFTSKSKCRKLLQRLQTDKGLQIFFGEDFHIEEAELDMEA